MLLDRKVFSDARAGIKYDVWKIPDHDLMERKEYGGIWICEGQLKRPE